MLAVVEQQQLDHQQQIRLVWVAVVMAYTLNRGFKRLMVVVVQSLMDTRAAVLLEIEQEIGHNMEFMVQAAAAVQVEQILEVKEVLV
jgi:hypothetical protein